MAKYQEIIVENHKNPIRLDRYLRSLNPILQQGILEKYLRQKLIKVNGEKASSNLRIADGDVISVAEIIINQIITTAEKHTHNEMAKILAEKLLGDYLIYDHQDFIAINKPSGLATQGGSKIRISVDDALIFLRDEGMDLKLVHRLDKDTSGILIIAKNRDAADKFMKAFRSHKIQKTYLALLSGVPNKKSGQIISYLIKEKDFEVSSYEHEVEGSKIAKTDYKILSAEDNVAFAEFKPLTGRMHQLRVHSKLLGCPIIGDMRYGTLQASHLMLHAACIVIDKCIFGTEIKIEATLPDYFGKHSAPTI